MTRSGNPSRDAVHRRSLHWPHPPAPRRLGKRPARYPAARCGMPSYPNRMRRLRRRRTRRRGANLPRPRPAPPVRRPRRDWRSALCACVAGSSRVGDHDRRGFRSLGKRGAGRSFHQSGGRSLGPVRWRLGPSGWDSCRAPFLADARFDVPTARQFDSYRYGSA